ncbi:hypothetical protein [Desulfovibrio sp. ZJ200]|uniref:hypothetical protein n=1 Tax=Desulfovibrio sp. ZJ200 TaxID=2709792 RepID=UPI0013EC73C2|nr:hypothetical protein [Desulfovibrio sp. ZJ200]
MIENPQFIRMFFTQYKEIPTYTAYCEQDAIPENRDDSSDDISDGISDDISSNNIRYIVRFIKKWTRSYFDNDQLHLSPVLCSRIMNRFFASLRKIDSESSNENTFIGMYVHRCLVAFFNSILVEEFLLCQLVRNINIDSANPITNDQIFVSNLSEVNNGMYSLREILPLFTFVFSCPLWGLYLKSRDENGKEMPVYTEYMKFQDRDKEELKEAYKVVLLFDKEKKEFPNPYSPLNSLAIQRK